jgi:hypothetical protein
VKRVRRLGEVEAATHGFAHRAQLLEVHGVRSLSARPAILWRGPLQANNRFLPSK